MYTDDVRVPTEKVVCLQVTSQLQEFLNHFPPESKEKAFKQIYKILQALDAYLIDNPQQHLSCMSPDSEYVSLIMYATKLEIDLCNFPAIWAVLSILLDTQSNELQYVKKLQQVVDDYYDKCPTEVMTRLEHQKADIMDAMYDSINNDNFDSISDYADGISMQLIMIMIEMTKTMMICPMTETMMICPMTEAMMICPMTKIMMSKCLKNMLMIMKLP